MTQRDRGHVPFGAERRDVARRPVAWWPPRSSERPSGGDAASGGAFAGGLGPGSRQAVPPVAARAPLPSPSAGSAAARRGAVRRRRRRTAVDRREEHLGEAGDGVGRGVGAVEDLGLDLEADQAVAALHLEPQLAELDPVPAHDLAARRAGLRPATLTRTLSWIEAARRRRQDHVADARVVAPDHPAIRDRPARRACRAPDRRPPGPWARPNPSTARACAIRSAASEPPEPSA